MKLLRGMLQSLVLAMALMANAEAGTICLSGNDCTPPPPAESIGPIEGPSVSLQPWVLELTPFEDSNGWNYSFNARGFDIVSVSMPFFDGWNTNDVQIPEGWGYEVANKLAIWGLQGATSNNYGGVGASFLSTFEPTAVTAQIRNAFGDVFDRQVYIPLTPSAIEAGYTGAILAVPEPSQALLLGLGVAFIALRRRVDK